jgi:hypothetical protein
MSWRLIAPQKRNDYRSPFGGTVERKIGTVKLIGKIVSIVRIDTTVGATV